MLVSACWSVVLHLLKSKCFLPIPHLHHCVCAHSVCQVTEGCHSLLTVVMVHTPGCDRASHLFLCWESQIVELPGTSSKSSRIILGALMQQHQVPTCKEVALAMEVSWSLDTSLLFMTKYTFYLFIYQLMDIWDSFHFGLL